MYISMNLEKHPCFSKLVYYIESCLDIFFLRFSSDDDRIKEIMMVNRNDTGSNPLLFAIMDQDLILFECFHSTKHYLGKDRLPVRFRRVSFISVTDFHGVVTQLYLREEFWRIGSKTTKICQYFFCILFLFFFLHSPK